MHKMMFYANPRICIYICEQMRHVVKSDKIVSGSFGYYGTLPRKIHDGALPTDSSVRTT